MFMELQELYGSVCACVHFWGTEKLILKGMSSGKYFFLRVTTKKYK